MFLFLFFTKMFQQHSRPKLHQMCTESLNIHQPLKKAKTLIQSLIIIKMLIIVTFYVFILKCLILMYRNLSCIFPVQISFNLVNKWWMVLYTKERVMREYCVNSTMWLDMKYDQHFVVIIYTMFCPVFICLNSRQLPLKYDAWINGTNIWKSMKYYLHFVGIIYKNFPFVLKTVDNCLWQMNELRRKKV